MSAARLSRIFGSSFTVGAFPRLRSTMDVTADQPYGGSYLTLLDRMGVRPEKIGDSTGAIDQLTSL